MVSVAVREFQQLVAGPGNALLAVPWGCGALETAAASALRLSASALLAVVRSWKLHQGQLAAAARGAAAAAAAAGAGAGAALGGFGAGLLSRMAGRGMLPKKGSIGSGSGRRVSMGDAAAQQQRGARPPDAAGVGLLAACTACARLLAGWLRSEGAPGSRGAAGGSYEEVVECVATSLLLLLQEVPSGWLGPRGQDQGSELQRALLELLAGLCRAGGATGVGAADAGAAPPALRAAVLQLLIHLVSTELAPDEWLPAVSAHLALPQLLAAAATRAAAAVSLQAMPAAMTVDGAAAAATAPASPAEAAEQAVSDLSLLELALAVASVPSGALMLVQQGGLGAVGDYMRALLLEGGSLSPEAAVSASDSAGAYAVGAPTAAAAGGGGALGGAAAVVWAPAHQQWCVLMGVASALLQQAGGALEVGGAAVQLLSSCEQRLMLALSLPEGSPGQPLTLAALVEAERALALLEQMAGHAGRWQVELPASLGSMRAAVAAIITYAARPSLPPPGSKGQDEGGGEELRFRVACPPQSAFERRLAARPAAGLDASSRAGWLDACAAGSMGAGGRGRSNGAAAAAAAQVAQQPPSEYAARLGEAVYACTARAFSFLAATSPAVAPGEAASLGPMWPQRGALLAVARQCAGLGKGLLSGSEPLASRRRRLGACCARVLAAAAPFLEAVGASREACARAREDGAALQRALGAAWGGE